MKKRLTMMVVALITLCGAAADDFYGKVSTMAKVDAMAAGQWYALYNGSKFICDAGDGTLTTSTTPALNLAQNYTGCFMQVDGDNLVSGYGNTVGLAADYASGYTIYQVTLQDEADLSASQRLTFDSKMIKAGCLARFYCKRNVARYLTSTESGTAKGAAKTSNTDKSQIWLVTCTSSNDGSYTLLNASTGEYLTSDYDCPGSETTLYIQQSPNNGSDDYYYNISSSSAFSGSTCLNLGNDGSTLYEWSYSNDAGCDWAIEIVYEMTEDEVMDELRGNVTYASELTSGKYYQVISYAYSKYMAETGGQVKCMSEDVENFAQYWQLTKSGNGWTFRNVMTDNYIQKQNTTYSLYYTGTAEQAFYLTSATEGLNTIWYLNNEQNGSRGMHCDASSNEVPWTTTGVDASKWLFQEVELTAEDIAAAKESYADYQSLVSNLSTIQGHLDNLFADKACTQLLVSADALATNEDYLALPEAIQAQVAKVANDTWGLVASDGTSYEKAFRIASYQPYSHYTKMAGSDYTAQSNSYGKLSGPTGIYANSSDVLFIYVDQDPDIYCTLQAELVMTDGNAGDHQTGTTTSLTKGLNIIQASEQDVVYIFYQLNDPDKYLANYPDITIHIEGGEVNGMMDVTRGMTNTDWANMKSLGLLECCPVLNLKTEHLVFAMTSDLVTAAMTAAAKSNGDSVEDAEKLLRIWETIVANEERYQGLDDFDGRLRNIWNVFTVDYNYMYASTYGTYYNESTIPSIMNY